MKARHTESLNTYSFAETLEEKFFWSTVRTFLTALQDPRMYSPEHCLGTTSDATNIECSRSYHEICDTAETGESAKIILVAT